MSITPTPIKAALAGIFSALAWPLLWSYAGDDGSAGSVGLIVGALLLVALPAHVLVVGMGRANAQSAGRVDIALLKRIGAWLGAAAVTALLSAAYRA